MKVTIVSTEKIVKINGVPARVWEGKTENGIPCHAFITRIACHNDADSTEFEKELTQQAQPSADVQSYPSSLVI